MTHFIFDCDDVLLDWQAGFAAFIKDTTALTLDPAGPQSWCLADWIGNGCTVKEALSWVREFNASQAFGDLRAMPDARDVVWALRDAGHTISVLTACGDGRDVQRARMDNLTTEFKRGSDRFFYALPFEQIQFIPLGASKFENLYAASRYEAGTVFIEDNFMHAQSGVATGIRTYCLRRNHNRRDEAENPDTSVIWIDDLRALIA